MSRSSSLSSWAVTVVRPVSHPSYCPELNLSPCLPILVLPSLTSLTSLLALAHFILLSYTWRFVCIELPSPPAFLFRKKREQKDQHSRISPSFALIGQSAQILFSSPFRTPHYPTLTFLPSPPLLHPPLLHSGGESAFPPEQHWRRGQRHVPAFCQPSHRVSLRGWHPRQETTAEDRTRPQAHVKGKRMEQCSVIKEITHYKVWPRETTSVKEIDTLVLHYIIKQTKKT